MGLGKTIMTISLMLKCSGKGGSYASSASQASIVTDDIGTFDQSPNSEKKMRGFSSLAKMMKSKQTLIGGGNLIVCPMTLLGQRKV